MPLVKMSDVDPKVLGQRLRAERERLGLSQEEFGKIGGVSRISQYLYELGDRLPTLGYVIRVIPAGVNLGYLIFGASDSSHNVGRCFDQQTLRSVYRLVDEVARDKKGRLLDLEHRLALFGALCEAVADKAYEEHDWEKVRASFRTFVA